MNFRNAKRVRFLVEFFDFKKDVYIGHKFNIEYDSKDNPKYEHDIEPIFKKSYHVSFANRIKNFVKMLW